MLVKLTEKQKSLNEKVRAVAEKITSRNREVDEVLEFPWDNGDERDPCGGIYFSGLSRAGKESFRIGGEGEGYKMLKLFVKLIVSVYPEMCAFKMRKWTHQRCGYVHDFHKILAAENFEFLKKYNNNFRR
jgi:hypothetical protein